MAGALKWRGGPGLRPERGWEAGQGLRLYVCVCVDCDLTEGPCVSLQQPGGDRPVSGAAHGAGADEGTGSGFHAAR